MSRGPHTSSHPNYPWGTLGINDCGGPVSRLLLDTKQLSLWSLKPPACFLLIHYRNGTVWMRQTLSCQSSLSGTCNSVLFSHEFLIMPESPSPLQGGIHWTRSRPLFSWIWNQLFLMEQTVNPRVWTDGKLWVEHKILLLLSSSIILTYFHIKSSIH